MQVHQLRRHQKFASAEIENVDVRLGVVSDDRFMLRFKVDGCGQLFIPKEGPCDRADNLWQSTCFELFVHRGLGRYTEFNFSPSRAWAAYDFCSYRVKTGEHSPNRVPEILAESGNATFAFTVFLPAIELLGAENLAISAVLDEGKGRLSYWALTHGKCDPDFHDPTSFVLPPAALPIASSGEQT